MYQFDNRTVLTLDAGGSNFAFSAIQGNKEIIPSFTLPASPNDLGKCLKILIEGFSRSVALLQTSGWQPPVAISFAFPGPADYKNGIIGDLPNFPAFRGGVPLGPYLQQYFKLPVFINNDGNLFAYGEALAGALPAINQLLENKNGGRKYRNLIGLTFGTGFGSGVVINNILLDGDNGCGGDIWTFRNKRYPTMLAEENVSIRGIIREYGNLAGVHAADLTPQDIFEIAEGKKKGHQQAAIRSFELLGEVAADSIAHVIAIVDGLVVLGGGLMGAQKFIMPALMEELRTSLHTFSGDSFNRLETQVFDLTDVNDQQKFYASASENRFISFKNAESVKMDIRYNERKQTAIAVSSLGTNRAIAIGAYNFALHQLDHDQ